MTTDNLEATLIDDSCFADIFTMQSQTLNDFEFGLEANNIDNLLELFEEREKRNVDSYFNNTLLINNISNNIESKTKKSVTVTLKRENNESITISSPKVRKSTTSSSAETSTKSKGISLLAKPKKSNAKRSIINMNDSDPHSSSFSFPRDHDYCLISNDNNLFNKLPDYITSFKSVSQEDRFSNIQENNTFDKIPNYIKGFFNFNDDIDINEDQFFSESDDNILIELNEAYIEVSDVFFDNKITSNESNKIEDNNVDDFNSMSNSSTYSNTTSAESEDTERLKEIIENEQLLPQEIEQKDYKNNNNNSNVEKKQISRKSRSRSREPRTKSYSNSSTRRRRISTRSSVDSSSQSSRSSSCSSSCSSYTSYSSRSDNESKINYKISNSIVRNDNNKGQQFANKRTLKESYCQNNYQRSKIRPNFNDIVNNRRNNSKPKPSINLKQDIEQRKIIYVGKIPDGTTKTDIRHWFGRFGAIKEVSIHFRDYGDNYAFVTFYRRCDAYEAIEHANEDSRHPKFDLSFGGRRQFCKRRYEDLDYAEDDASFNSERMDFDSLLRSTQAKISR